MFLAVFKQEELVQFLGTGIYMNVVFSCCWNYNGWIWVLDERVVPLHLSEYDLLNTHAFTQILNVTKELSEKG